MSLYASQHAEVSGIEINTSIVILNETGEFFLLVFLRYRFRIDLTFFDKPCPKFLVFSEYTVKPSAKALTEG